MRAWVFFGMMSCVAAACSGNETQSSSGSGASSATSGSTASSSSAAGGNSASSSSGTGGSGGMTASSSSGSGGSASSTGTGGGSGNGIVVDHTSIALFDQIPDTYLQAARNLRMMFSDRSVGQNIHEYLNCLPAATWATSLASCRRDYTDSAWNWKVFTQTDLDNNMVPSRILFTPDPVKYDRSNWVYEAKTGDWSSLTQDFIQVLAPAYVATTDVLSYQFSYLNVMTGDDIASMTTGFFTNNPNKYDVHDLEAYIAQNPGKTFFFWTTSLARAIGTQEATDFNSQMRQYAAQNGKILFDVADIESHTDQGVPCYDNRDGVQYCTTTTMPTCEDYPDDGVALPAICQDYTTEIDGGHLGSVSGGGIQIAKGFWVLMARIAGWTP